MKRVAWLICLTTIACGGSREPSGEALGKVAPTPKMPERFASIGRPASDSEVKAWDIDVNSSGVGLPAGSGTHATGAVVFAVKCASCHGASGEGIPPLGPKLVGRDPREGFPFGEDYKLARTVGNYWPYATTLYDYIHRAMPLNAPGSLAPDEIYGTIAWILAENEIVGRDFTIDARSLPAVRMPARDRFVVDDRAGGSGFR
jgi:S-disulfanyl-L-cysteine oxidoreductase SoxD